MPDPDASTDDGAPAVVQPRFAPGTVIAKRYRLESRIGSGGGGTVWRCFDEKLATIVAFKIIDDDVDLERWRREVAMARRIADRNVCRVHDLGETAELRFVTMELVEGTSLRAKIHPDLPAAEARALFRQIASGAAAIHAAGVVHRDLKPENIVVDTSGRAVIVDFGLAREPRGDTSVTLRGSARAGPPQPAQTVTSAGVIVGTPRYMSPEQAVGETVDARTDVWALALIGHELLTGVVPTLDDERGGRRVGELAKWPQAAGVLRRCLALSPQDRPADARALLAALAEPVRGRGRLAIAAIAAVAAVGAVIGVRLLIAGEARSPKPAPVIAKAEAVRLVKLTSTDAKQWPMEAPISVALSSDATQLAYTTAHGQLRVRALTGGDFVTWELPVFEKASATRRTDEPMRTESLVNVFAVGWLDARGIAVLGTTRAGQWRLYRVDRDGAHVLLHAAAQRFPVAVAPDGKTTVIASPQIYAVLPGDQLQQLASVGTTERVTALAFSPDGRRIASVLDRDAALSLHVMSATGGDVKRVALDRAIGDLLVWLDEHRLAFAEIDGERSRIVVHDLRTGETRPRTEWSTDHIAGGSAAQGIALLVGGPASLGVHVGDKDGWPQQRLHDASTRGTRVVGWTDDGRVVFAAGEPGREQVVRGSLERGVEPWPNTTAGVERPDAVLGNDVITHRRDGKEIVVERIDPSGTHTELARFADMPLDRFVRCAGDRAAPCILAQSSDGHISWTELDVETRTLGNALHRRTWRAVQSAALSHDGKFLAIVEDTRELHLVSIADRSVRTIAMRDAAAMQSVAFAANGDLWISSLGFRGSLYGLARYSWAEKLERPLDSTPFSVSDKRSLMRSFAQPTPSRDAAHVAVGVRELRLEITRIDGL